VPINAAAANIDRSSKEARQQCARISRAEHRQLRFTWLQATKMAHALQIWQLLDSCLVLAGSQRLLMLQLPIQA
jgi:hypothetical protein